MTITRSSPIAVLAICTILFFASGASALPEPSPRPTPTIPPLASVTKLPLFHLLTTRGTTIYAFAFPGLKNEVVYMDCDTGKGVAGSDVLRADAEQNHICKIFQSVTFPKLNNVGAQFSDWGGCAIPPQRGPDGKLFCPLM